MITIAKLVSSIHATYLYHFCKCNISANSSYLTFYSDGWYMMLAMDFAVQEINSHPEYDFQLESIKLDTCGTYESDFWLTDYTAVSDSIVFFKSSLTISLTNS